jgi:hypothetical protein
MICNTEKCTEKAIGRLLFTHSAFDRIEDFDHYLSDLASVTNISPTLLHEARATFLRNLQQNHQPAPDTKSPQKARFHVASIKYWLFDLGLLIAISHGLSSLCSPLRSESVKAPPPKIISTTPPSEQNNFGLYRGKLFQVNESVEVYDESIPYGIPWEIKDVYSDKDGSTRYEIQRHIGGRHNQLVLKNIQPNHVKPITQHEPNTKAMCEFHLEIFPCTVIKLEHTLIPGGGLYSVSFVWKDGKRYETTRPYWNVWKIVAEGSDTFTFKDNPLLGK